MLKKNKEEILLNIAVNSRLFLIFLGYISNIIIPDHNAGIFGYPKPVNVNYTVIDNAIFHILGGYLRWDGQYFMHITLYGYTYENTVAFFPLYPFLVRTLSVFIQYFISDFVSLESTVLVLFVLVNILIFILSVKTLYKITCLLFNSTVAFNTAIAFCFNPASIFFIAPYTECLYSFLTFKSIQESLVLFKTLLGRRPLKIQFADCTVLLPISLSMLVRSNGILNLGFFLYSCICSYKCYILTKPKENVYTTSLKYFSTVIFCCIISCIPFLLYQIYCYYLFCNNFDNNLPENIINHAVEYGFILPGTFHRYNQSWCYKTLPLAYSYVQQHYWKVGFLQYYEIKQIPNFLLALPILCILFIHCCRHLSKNIKMNPLDIFSLEKRSFLQNNKQVDFFSSSLNVFVIHGFLLVIFCIFFVHIQVSTRMLCSASPLIYWYCAKYFINIDILKITHKSMWYHLSKMQLLLIVYFGSYFVIGTVMFCNSLPWT